MGSFTLGIDLGSSGTKLTIIDATGLVIATAAREMTLESPRAGWAEADTRRWWRNVCALVPEVISGADISASDVSAVATSGMVPAVVPLDSSGRVLRPAILQNDARGTSQIKRLADRLAHLDLVARTGSALTQQSVAPTLLWLAENEPEVWEQTHYVVGSYDWLAMALGAEPHVETNWALESGLFELSGLEVLEAVLFAAAVDPSLLPPPKAPGVRVGEVSGLAGAATGLVPGTPIIVGGADHVLSAYAAGLNEAGDWLIKLGGAGDILAVSRQLVCDPRLYLDAHPRPGLWLPNGCMATSGSLIRWLQQLLGNERLETLDAEAEQSRPGELICLPYFLGEKSPVHDPELRGAFVGLHLGHSRGDLYRSALEGIAYGFRHHLDVFADVDVVLGQARVTNGGSRSPTWKSILADVLGVPLLPVLGHPGASLGAAMIAEVGTHSVPDWCALRSPLPTGPAIEPNAGNRDRYDAAYQIYLETAGALAPLSHRLSAREEQ